MLVSSLAVEQRYSGRDRGGDRMIRAILTNGTIQPLDCLPADWVEGQELRVDPVERPRESAEDIDRWYQELESLCTAGDPDDERRLQAAGQST